MSALQYKAWLVWVSYCHLLTQHISESCHPYTVIPGRPSDGVCVSQYLPWEMGVALLTLFLYLCKQVTVSGGEGAYMLGKPVHQLQIFPVDIQLLALQLISGGTDRVCMYNSKASSADQEACLGIVVFVVCFLY